MFPFSSAYEAGRVDLQPQQLLRLQRPVDEKLVRGEAVLQSEGLEVGGAREQGNYGQVRLSHDEQGRRPRFYPTDGAQHFLGYKA